MGTLGASEGRRFPLHLAGGLVLLALSLSLTRVQGQEIRGHLLEAESGQPIPWATMALLDTAFTAVAHAVSGQNGAFSVQAPGPGAYYLLGEALGYEPKVDGILELGPGGSVSVAFYLKPKPIELDALKVAIVRVRTYQHLSDVGYYERAKMGFGSYVSPETIERRNPSTTFDLLRGVPGLYFEEGGREGTRVFLIRGGYRCNPAVYVDGSRVFNDPHTERGGPPEDLTSGGADTASIRVVSRDHAGIVLDYMVNIQDISAVEVHTRATSVPLLYGGTQETCGVLLIWTHLTEGREP